MFYSRRVNHKTNKVEVWECEWLNRSSSMSRKKFVRKVGDEEELKFSHDDYSTADAVCWAPNATIGNTAVSSAEVFGVLKEKSGNNTVLPCQIIPCGKFRHGAKRWYCKTHQTHWGTKADFVAASEFGEVMCSNRLTKMNYVINPLEIDFNEFEEIGIWCSLPPAFSSDTIVPRPPKIHVYKVFTGSVTKKLDMNFDAIVCSYTQFKNTEITKTQMTPPAAFEFVRSIEESRPTSCVSCKKCGYLHLDLGSFAIKPHKKHFCGNCGNDSIWSKATMVSTPLKPLHDQFNNSNQYITPKRELNLDSYSKYRFELWASTPAVVWTADRPQEKGIHVHIYDGMQKIVDETFAKVVYRNKYLSRKVLWDNMVKNTIY